MGRELLDRHPSIPGLPHALDLFECPKQVVTLHNPFHETFIFGRTLAVVSSSDGLPSIVQGSHNWVCRLPVHRLSTSIVPSHRSGLKGRHNTRRNPFRPRVPSPALSIYRAVPSSSLRTSPGVCVAPPVESEEVELCGPASVRSIKRLVQFSASRFSSAAPLWSHQGTRPGMRWVSRTRPNSAISRRVGYRRHIGFRQRLARNE